MLIHKRWPLRRQKYNFVYVDDSRGGSFCVDLIHSACLEDFHREGGMHTRIFFTCVRARALAYRVAR
jgi:hypothetical protein